MTYLLAHHSGRYNNMAIKEAFGQYSSRASMVAHTEFGSDKRAKALRDVATKNAWGFYQKNQSPFDECCFTWKESSWKMEGSDSTVLSDIPWFSGATGNKMPDFAAVAVFLRHQKTKEGIIFVTCHTPSHVAIWDGFRPMSNRIRCYQDGVKNLGKWCRTLDTKWKQSGFVVTADWNAPCEQKWFRDYLEKNFAKHMHVMEPNAKTPLYPDTHDSRCIDWPVLGGAVLRKGTAKALKVADSDHKTLLFSVERKPHPNKKGR